MNAKRSRVNGDPFSIDRFDPASTCECKQAIDERGSPRNERGWMIARDQSAVGIVSAIGKGFRPHHDMVMFCDPVNKTAASSKNHEFRPKIGDRLQVGFRERGVAIGCVVERSVKLDMMQGDAISPRYSGQTSDLMHKQQLQLCRIDLRIGPAEIGGEAWMGTEVNSMVFREPGTSFHGLKITSMTAASDICGGNRLHEQTGFCGRFPFTEVAVQVESHITFLNRSF